MDGLPTCPHDPTLTAKKCLRLYPPDEVGGFCEWFGYATKRQVDRFERKRGYRRVVHEDGTGDTWEPR
jgi:hypothetical protein